MRVPQIEIFAQRGSEQFYYWRLRAANGQIVATGGEAYSSHSNAVRAARTVRYLFLGRPKIVSV